MSFKLKLLLLSLHILFVLANEKKFKKCEDSGFCSRSRKLFNQPKDSLPYFYYVEPQYIVVENNEVSGLIVNSNNENIYMRFKLTFIMGGIMKVIIDEAESKNHKRFKVSSMIGYETNNLIADNVSV
jgi:hypothetical protein